MDPSARANKFWFPYIKLSIFFVVVVSTLYFTLQSVNPGTAIDPSQWQAPAKTKKQKQVEWMLKFFGGKKKK